MKKIAFIGSYDKTDFLLYIAKIMTIAGKKVLIVDTTVVQKAKYVVPVIHPTKTYITDFENIDVAVGFDDMDEIRAYLGLANESELEYDYCLLDIDSYEKYCDFVAKESVKNYFVTSFDVYSLKRGIEVLAGIEDKIELTKILFSKDMLQEEDEYLEFLALNCNIEWKKEKIYFPFDRGDQSGIIENQRTARINFRNLSAQYKDGLSYVVEDILEADGIGGGEIRKIVRKIEKGA